MSLTPSEADQGGTPRLEGPKKEDSRTTVLNALRRAESFLSVEIPEDELSPEERWVLKSVQKAHQESLGKNKDTYTNNFTDSRTGFNYSQEEGIPVDGLIETLRLRANAMPTDDPQRKRLLEDARILERNSKKYEEMPNRNETGQKEARKEQEANRVFDDQRATGNDVTDWYKAEADLRNRRELVLPQMNVSPVSPDQAMVKRPNNDFILVDRDQTTPPPTKPEDSTSPARPDQAMIKRPDNGFVLVPQEEDMSRPVAPNQAMVVRPSNDLITIPESRPEPEPEAEIKKPKRQISKPRSRIKTKRDASRQNESTEDAQENKQAEQITTDAPDNSTSQDGPQQIDQTPLNPPEIFTTNLVDITEATDKAAQLEALKSTTEDLRRGNWWNPFHAIRRTAVRWLGKGLIIRRAEQLRGEMVANNTSGLAMNEVRNAAALANAIRNGQTEQAQVVERFREDHLRGNEVTEVATGELKRLIQTQIMAQIVDGRIATPEQLRSQFADFIRNNLNNPAVNLPGDTETVGAQMQRLFGAGANEFGRIADYFASDMIEVGGRIRTSLERHQDGLNNLDQKLAEMDDRIVIKLGRANMGSGGETRTFIDRLVVGARRRQSADQEQDIRGGLAYHGVLLNPVVVGISAALAWQGLTVAARRGIQVGLVGGGIAGTIATGGVGPIVAGAVAGGLVAAGRRYFELKQDRIQHNMERANGEQLTAPSRGRIGRLFQRLTGGGSREDFDRFRHNAVTADQLINGDRGNTDNPEPLSNSARRSVAELLGLELGHGHDNNRLEIARRIAEIQTRLDFVADSEIDVNGQKIRTVKADLLQFKDKTDANTSPTELLHQAAILRKALETDGYTAQEVQELLTTEQQAMSRFFIGNVEQRNREFQVYRVGNALASGAFAGTVGFAIGLAGQRVIEGVGNLMDNFRPPVTTTAASNEFLNQTTFQDLSQKGGTLRHDGFNLAVDEPKLESAKNPFDHTGLRGGFVDDSNARISPPTHVIPASDNIPAKIIVSGTPDNLPEIPKNVMTGAGWQHEVTNDPNYNLRVDVKDMLLTGRPDGFTHGDMRIIVNDLANRDEWYKLHDTQGVDMPGSKNVIFIYQDPNLGEIVMQAKGEVVGDVPQLKFDPSTLSPEQWEAMQAQFQKDGWGMQEGITVEQPVLGAEGEWAKHTTPVERQWYGYNTPWSELNELREYSMDKVGSKVTLDMSSMQISSQSELNPPVVNVPDVIARHEAAWAFTLPGQMDKPFIVSDGADGVFDGKLTLDPNDNDPTHYVDTPSGRMQLGEFSKIVLNQERLAQLPDGNIATEYYTNFRGDNRLDVWRLNGGQQDGVGFISAGRYIEQGGKNIFQSFATIRGTGATPETITTGGGVSLTPPEATVYTPPVPPIKDDGIPPREPIPFVPIPFAPRHPLDPTKPPPPPPPSGGYNRRRSGEQQAPVEMTDLPSDAELFGDENQIMGGRPRPNTDNPATTVRLDDTIPTSTETTVNISPTDPARTGTTQRLDTSDRDLENLQLELANERTSPVAPASRAEAIRRAELFVNSPTIRETEEQKGISKSEAAKLYKQMLDWRKANDITKLESEDPGLSPEDMKLIQGIIAIYYEGQASEAEIDRKVNLIARFIKDNGVNINKGQKEYNIFALAELNYLVENLELS